MYYKDSSVYEYLINDAQYRTLIKNVIVLDFSEIRNSKGVIIDICIFKILLCGEAYSLLLEGNYMCLQKGPIRLSYLQFRELMRKALLKSS